MEDVEADAEGVAAGARNGVHWRRGMGIGLGPSAEKKRNFRLKWRALESGIFENVRGQFALATPLQILRELAPVPRNLCRGGQGRLTTQPNPL